MTAEQKDLLREYVLLSAKTFKRKPQVLNLLDSDPISSTERRALRQLAEAINNHTPEQLTVNNLQVLSDLLLRTTRALGAYQSNYVPPIRP